MADKPLDADTLKAVLRILATMEANIENWKYVEVNADYLDKKRVSDALSQILGTFEPLIHEMRNSAEIEALTTFDIIDLI